VSTVRIGNWRRQTIIVRRIRVDRWDQRHICRLRCDQAVIVGLFRQALAAGLKFQAGLRGKVKTNVDGLDPSGSLVGGKRSPLPPHARVGTNGLCTDRCHQHAKGQE